MRCALELVGVHRDANTRRLRDHFGAAFPLDAFYADADARFEAMWRDGVPLRPGARETLAWLAERAPPDGDSAPRRRAPSPSDVSPMPGCSISSRRS